MSDTPVYFVQHRDKVVGRASFATLSYDELHVRTTFPTLQGEGPLAGQYVFFARLAGCNYGDKEAHCQFCDTDFRMSESKVMTFSDLRKMWEAEKCTTVVVSGGEPTLQRNIISLIRSNPNIFFQIESNGSQAGVVEELLTLDNCMVVISPKWSKSGHTIDPTPRMLARAVFKFLVSADVEENDNTLPGWAIGAHQPFYLSPIAVYRGQYEGEVVSAWGDSVLDRDLTAKNYAYAATEVIRLSRAGYKARLSIQQHIFTSIP